jgi:hypothetical protein
MVVLTKKFSDFVNGGNLSNNDVTVGLGGATNAFFNNPWTFLPPGTTEERPIPADNMYYRLRLNTTLEVYEYFEPVTETWAQLTNTSTINGHFVTYEDDPGLPQSFNLADIGPGILKQSVSMGSAIPAIAALGSDYYGNGMTGVMQSPAGIADSSGNLVVSFAGSINASNHITLLNAAAGFPPQISVDGFDTNISAFISSKGNESVILRGAFNGTNALSILSGTDYHHSTIFNFPNSSASRNITFQDSSGTLAFLSDIPGVTPSALTRTNDSNITITLTGNSSDALLQSVNMQLGWNGVLSPVRGGTGLSALGTGVQTALSQNVTGTTGIVLSTNPTITSPYINQINDVNGNTILSLLPQAVALDYIRIRNSAAGGIPLITVGGLTTDKGIGIVPAGAGRIAMSSLSSTPLQIQSGTGYNHIATFSFANTLNTNDFMFPDASGTIALQGAVGVRSFQVFTSGAGTYNRPAGVTSIMIELVGGGGAGGGCVGALLSLACGGGGASGSYCRHYIASAAASYSYSVGAGGSPGAAGNNPGGNGGSTTFSTLTANGGLGGRPGGSVAGGGASTLATGGNLLNASGTQGGTGIALSGNAVPGTGGSSVFGGGANAPTVTGGSGNGLAGSAYGGGGSGGYALNLLVNAAGGAGSAGVIVVWEFS